MTAQRDCVLLADLGGTNVRFAIADVDAPQPLRADSVRRYRVAECASFAAAARAYLASMRARPRSGVFAVAGPVTGDEVRMTNHPWVLSRAALLEELGFDALRIVNDFAAMSHCLLLLGGEHAEAIGPVGPPRIDVSKRQTFAIVGPGTGLGVGGLIVDGGRFVGLPAEGGHVGFAPGDDVEIEVLRRLAARFGRVSAERVLCGSGLVNLHLALHPDAGDGWTPERVTAEAVSDPACDATVERFCALLGSFAGDVALAYGAWDGVWLAGGLTPTVLRRLQSGAFRERFENKGRYRRVLEQVPTTAILHPDAGLLGAAALAVLEAGRLPAGIAKA